MSYNLVTLTGASLLLEIRLKSGLAFATASGQRPFSVPLAEVRGGAFGNFRAGHARTCRLFDNCHFFSRRCCLEVREIYRHFWTGDVVHLQQKAFQQLVGCHTINLTPVSLT